FDPKNVLPPASDAENIDALKEGAGRLTEAAGAETGPGAMAAKRLAAALVKIAEGDKDLRDRTEAAFLPPLKITLAGLEASLQAAPVTLASLPAELVRDWMLPDGRARVEVGPKGGAGDNEAMRRFARAVLAVEPDAVEGPTAILEAGDTVVRAFVEAGLWALLSIAALLSL